MSALSPLKLNHNFLEVFGSKIHFVTLGRRTNPPLFLIHSFYLSWAVFKPCLKDLSERFFLVIPDLPGFGESEMLKAPNNSFNYAQVLEEIRKFLDCRKISLYGFSAGGIVVLKYASLHSNSCDKVCEQGAPYFYQDYQVILRDKLLLWSFFFPAFPRFLKWLACHHFIWPLIRRISKNLDVTMRTMENGRIERDFARMNLRAAYEWGRDILKIDLRYDLGKIICPIEIIIGNHDPYLSLASIFRMSGFIKDCRVMVLEGGDHEMTIKDPDLIVGKLTEFLK